MYNQKKNILSRLPEQSKIIKQRMGGGEVSGWRRKVCHHHNVNTAWEGEKEEGVGKQPKRRRKKKKVKTQKHFIKCRSVFFSRPSSVGVSATSLGGYMQKVNTWNYTWRVTSDICASIKKKKKKKIQRCNLANEGFGSRAGGNKGRLPAETSWISPSRRLTRFW